ncbi:MAG TPA: chemotaxis protein CheA [Nitrospirota bacterium]|nr:chemotaxis protein CheA [Nitrospirota bacterium]
MGEYTFTEHELSELKEVFFTEAYEIVQLLNQEALNLEAGHDREGSLKNIQRHLHTLKGNSRALGFTCLNTLSHKAEDLMKKIHDTSMEVDQGLIDLILGMNDTLQLYLDGYKSNMDVKLDERIMERIEGYLCASGNGSDPDKQTATGTDGGSASCVYDINVIFDRKCDMKSSGASLIVERLSTLGEILSVEPSMESGMLDQADRIAIRLGAADSAAPVKEMIDIPGIVEGVEIKIHGGNEAGAGKQEQKNAAVKSEVAQTLRVEAQRVDKMLNLVGELVIGRSMVGQVLTELEERNKKDGLVKRLGDANAFMEKTLSQLQKNVMKIRMLPIAQAFRKFPRVVRDLSIEKGKQIELVMEGEKTEIDKSILDVIGEPLIHLVRNAVDHGIELPEERERIGKSPKGKITLRAAHEGNQIVIDIIDDGAGLDPARLRKKAVQKGIKTQDEADRLSDEEAEELIFQSGFSTADVVSDISGRGFGMDIVRTTMESLKGRIQVRSKTGEGSVFTLRLPLTLAIIRAMLFWIGDRLFALPMSTIEKITRIKDNDIQIVGGREVLRFRDKVISLVSLKESLIVSDTGEGQGRRKFVIVVGLAEKLYGFLVDRLVGQQELVIKVLDNHWGTVNCTSGASILGSGKVVLILDAPALIAREIRREAGKA